MGFHKRPITSALCGILPPRSIQTASQVLLQATLLPDVLLGPRVLGGPLATALRHRHLRRRPRYALGTLSSGAGDGPDGLPESQDLIQNVSPHLADIVDDFELKVECRRADRLVGGIVPDLQVGVLEGLFDTDPGGRVESEHLVEEIEGIGVGVGEQAREGLLGHVRQVSDVFLSTGGAYPGQGLLVGRSQDVEDLVQLVDIVAALEEWAAAEELGQDTSDGPNVN